MTDIARLRDQLRSRASAISSASTSRLLEEAADALESTAQRAEQIASLLLQQDREGAKDWARGLSVTAGATVITLDDAREIATLRERADALHKALRDECIRHSSNLSGRTEPAMVCNLCRGRWKPDAAEQHAPDCLAATISPSSTPPRDCRGQRPICVECANGRYERCLYTRRRLQNPYADYWDRRRAKEEKEEE